MTTMMRAGDDEDRALIVEARQGQEAFGALIQKYQTRVFGTVYRLVRNQQDAEDLTQEVFLKAYQGLTSYDEARPFSPWLMRIAVNTAISFLRHRTVAGVIPLAEAHHPVVKETTVALATMQAFVHQAVAALSPQERIAFTLLQYEDLSYDEVGAAMGVPLTTVRNLIFRARQQVKSALAREGVIRV